MSDNRGKRSGRVRLLAVVGVVVVPLAVAWVIYFYFPQLAPSGKTNEGVFITPPVSAEELAVENLQTGQWTMIFLGDGSCDGPCKSLLYIGRQIHTAMGKDRNRIKRVYLFTQPTLSTDFAEFLKSDHPRLETYRVDERDLVSSLGKVLQDSVLQGNGLQGNGLQDNDLQDNDLQDKATKKIPLHRHLFLMDPLGNIIMYYVPEKVGKPLQKDLKTLLKLSNIG